MLFSYLYHGDLYSDLWKSDLYFGPAVLSMWETQQGSKFRVILFYTICKRGKWIKSYESYRISGIIK